jgi:hypothetical protein
MWCPPFSGRTQTGNVGAERAKKSTMDAGLAPATEFLQSWHDRHTAAVLSALAGSVVTDDEISQLGVRLAPFWCVDGWGLRRRDGGMSRR